jgi:hypothetical protein
VPADVALVAYLDTVLSETAGTNLFEGPAPESPDDLIAVTNYDSMEAEDRVMAGSLADQQAIYPAMVQVLSRSTSKATAYARAFAAFGYLDNLGPVTLSGVTYHSVECTEPHFLQQDGNHRWQYTFDATVRKGRG